MTEFIARSCKAESRYEVIIKIDSEEHYKATEDFARRLIDHAKPKTNADRIRAMSDEEFAEALTDECLERESCYGCFAYRDDGNCPGASISAWLKWLQQPAEGE